MTTPAKFSSAELLSLQRQLARWRQDEPGRPRLPAEVWDATAALAQRHRPSAVAHTLGLSYPKLRQRMSRPRFEAPTAPVSFVELNWVPPAGSASDPVGCAELRDPSGRVLRLHVGNDPQVLLALAAPPLEVPDWIHSYTWDQAGKLTRDAYEGVLRKGA